MVKPKDISIFGKLASKLDPVLLRIPHGTLRQITDSLLCRFVTSPAERIPVEPRKVNKKIKRMDAFSTFVPEITILLRLKEDIKCRARYLDPNRGCQYINLIR